MGDTNKTLKNAEWAPMGVTMFPIFASWLALPAIVLGLVGLPGPIDGLVGTSQAAKYVIVGAVVLLAIGWGYAVFRHLKSTTRDGWVTISTVVLLSLMWIALAVAALSWTSHAPTTKDDVRAAFFLLSAFAAAIAGVLTWGRTSAQAWQTQLAFTTLEDARRVSAREHVNELLAKASEQLADKDDVVRSAAIYGLERAYDQAGANQEAYGETERPSNVLIQRTVVELLCGFVRHHSRLDHAKWSRSQPATGPVPRYRSPTSVLAAIDVLGRLGGPEDAPATLYDLSDAVISDLRWAGVHLPAVRAPRLRVTGRTVLRRASFTGLVDLSRATFDDQVDASNLRAPAGFKAVKATFARCDFSKGECGSPTTFSEAKFRGQTQWDSFEPYTADVFSKATFARVPARGAP